jgi:peptidoglycan hydrolase-like protein with peptidoglycan-binding domain
MIRRNSIAAATLFVALAVLPVEAAAGGKVASKHDRADIVAVQQALNKQGAALTVDGIVGQRTRDALRSSQRSHGLKDTGRLDAATEKVLRVSDPVRDAGAG